MFTTAVLIYFSCQRLRKPLNVDVYPPECIDNQTLPSFTECGFSCPPGRKLKGSLTRQCINGDWTNTYPTCLYCCVVYLSLKYLP